MDIVIEKKCQLTGAYTPVFARESFLQCKSKYYGYVYGYELGRMLFCLPYIIKRKYFFSILEFQTDVIRVGEAGLEKEQDFLDEMIFGVFKKLQVDFICQNPAYAIFSMAPHKSASCEFGSYVIDLSEPLESLWSKVHSKHRNVIRKAEKNNVVVSSGKEYYAFAYELMKDTQARSGHGFMSGSEFSVLLEALKGDCEVFVALGGDKLEIQGCAVIVYDSKRAYYLYGGSVIHPLLGSVNKMQWEIIKFLRSQGVLEYDFVGARLSGYVNDKLQGIQRFKKRFGGSLRQGVLWKCPNRLWKYKLYCYLMWLRTGKREIDAIDEGKLDG